MKRSGELPKTVTVKGTVLEGCRTIPGVSAVPELWGMDIALAIRAQGRLWLIALEIEMSIRNVIRNIQRNFSNGAVAVVVITTDQRLSDAISRKVRRELTPSLRERISILTFIEPKQ